MSERAPGVAATDEEFLRQIRAKRRARDRISEGDELLLTEFFSALGCAFERSVTGAVLEHQELAGATSKKCPKCKGTGVLEDDGFDMVLEQAEQEQRKKDQGRPIFDATRVGERKAVKRSQGAGYCNRCRGLGSVAVVYDEGRASRCEDCTLEPALRFVPDPPPPEACKPDEAPPELPPIFYGPWEPHGFHGTRGRYRRSQCRTCCGLGVGPMIYVGKRELAGGGSVPDGGKLSLFAQISRRIGRVRARSVNDADALKDFFGDLGNRWAPTRFGRVFALCHRTPAGKRLARLAEAWVAREKSGRKKPLTRKEANERIRWRNPAKPVLSDPFHELEAKALAAEQRTRARLEQELAAEHGVAVAHFIGPIRRRRLPRWKPRKLVCWLSEHPALVRKRDALLELEEQLSPLMSAQERIGWVANLVTMHEPNWASLLATARQQARELERRMAIAWNRSGGLPKHELAAVVRLVDRMESEGREAGADYIRRHAGAR